MNRRTFLKNLGSAAAAAGSFPLLSAVGPSGCRSGHGKRPNILFIMSDDHAANAIGCYGSRRPTWTGWLLKAPGWPTVSAPIPSARPAGLLS